MCGRIEYHLTSREQLEGHYGVKLVSGYTTQGFINARYNIAPTSHTPILTSEDSEEISEGHWGYLPSWAKTRKGVKQVINARAETILEKSYFKSSIEKRRCLIPVTGFYEWKRDGKKKTPYRFHMNDEIFSLAGLYTTIEDEKGNEMPHYAIITTEANELMAPIHNRMPVIIDKEAESDWISDGLSDTDLGQFLKPVPDDYLKCYEISTLVNSVKNNTADILKPVG